MFHFSTGMRNYMDENHRDRTGSNLTASEPKLWLPPLSPNDQQKLDRFRSKGKKSTSNWTGFVGRTLWDWIQFFAVLAIPILVAAGTLYFTQQITLQQIQLSDAANKQQHQTDLQIAVDQQRETTLKTYLDDMSNLLFNNKLLESNPGDPVRQVAREQTLITLRRLDANRNRIVTRFLQDMYLIAMKDAIIDLSKADLSGDDLSGADLEGANLFNVNLSGANLSGADLFDAHLSDADLVNTNLSRAALNGAILNGAILSGANLSGADLLHADLAGASVTQEQLNEARSLEGTIMPDGSTHP